MGLLVEMRPKKWHRGRLNQVLRLGGYVAFDFPRAVAGLGAALLVGIAATHLYILTNQPTVSWYFMVYAYVMIASCVLAGGSIGFGRKLRVAQSGWYFGSLISVVVLIVDTVTRVVSLPGLTAMTGRWDFAPATVALALAGAFAALHASVLLGINVAYPQRQHWED
ncbi:oxidoreductase [Mycobacterium haemophilum]